MTLPVLPHGALPPPPNAQNTQRPSDGPLAQELASLWTETQKRIWNPKYLWSHFQLRRKFDLNFLQPHEFRLLIPPGVLTHCQQCETICCTGQNSRVSLNLIDIARLIDANLETFIQPAPHKAIPSMQKRAAQQDAEASIFYHAFPVLRRDETLTCSLLTPNLQCGAFPHWPLSCERYPFAINLVEKTVFWAKGCGHQELHYEPEAHLRTRQLFHAALDAYNQRIKDAAMLYLAMPELSQLGLLKYLHLEGYLGKQAHKYATLNAENALADDVTQTLK